MRRAAASKLYQGNRVQVRSVTSLRSTSDSNPVGTTLSHRNFMSDNAVFKPQLPGVSCLAADFTDYFNRGFNDDLNHDPNHEVPI